MATFTFKCRLAIFIIVTLSVATVNQAGEAVGELPQSVRVNARSHPSMETMKRVASSLQKLERNLILERTRGEKEISVYQKAASAVVLVIAGKDSIGSGAVIGPEGRVLTNRHVIGSNQTVTVVFKPNNSTELRKELAFSASVEKVDQLTDLALLRISNPPKPVPFLTLGTLSSLSVGSDVHAIGHPQGEVWTYTRGLVSQIRTNYEWSTEAGIAHRATVIQTQTPINPGNSGGPLLDESGRLVGINSFRRQGGEGLNYAVSINTIEEFLAREGNRDSAGRASNERDMRCTEAYDTMRRGWNDIIGCYQDSVSPPPDVWLIFRSQTKMPAYIGLDSDTSGKSAKVDIIRRGMDPQWTTVELYVDSDCDGTVDLIVNDIAGEIDKSRSRLPPANLRMTGLAKELDGALKNRRIPYPRFRVCQ